VLRWELLRKTETDVAVKHLADTINRATRFAIPLRTRTFRSMQIAASTHTLIQKRNKHRMKGQRTHDITLRPLISSLKEQIHSAIKDQLTDTWQRTLQGLDSNSMNDTWRITKNVNKSNHNMPSLNINGKTATATREKLNLFGDILEHVFNTTTDAGHSSTISTEKVVNDFLK
jgi:hypothetical protein